MKFKKKTNIQWKKSLVTQQEMWIITSSHTQRCLDRAINIKSLNIFLDNYEHRIILICSLCITPWIIIECHLFFSNFYPYFESARYLIQLCCRQVYILFSFLKWRDKEQFKLFVSDLSLNWCWKFRLNYLKLTSNRFLCPYWTNRC